jgi:formylmethanofuran dehydrogenase subunit E
MISDYQQIIEFHGHSCPGLAMGYRMAAAVMDVLKKARAEDEELVAIVENDACGVGALQCLSGCTFGKGNLLFKDYGNEKKSRRGYGKHLKGGRFSCAAAICAQTGD